MHHRGASLFLESNFLNLTGTIVQRKDMSQTTELTGGCRNLYPVYRIPGFLFKSWHSKNHIFNHPRRLQRGSLCHTQQWAQRQHAARSTQERVDEHNNKVTRRVLVVGVLMERRVSWWLTGEGVWDIWIQGPSTRTKQSFFPPSPSASFQEYLCPDGSTENDRKRCSSYSSLQVALDIHQKRRRRDRACALSLHAVNKQTVDGETEHKKKKMKMASARKPESFVWTGIWGRTAAATHTQLQGE